MAVVVEHSTEIPINLGLPQNMSKPWTVSLELYPIIYIYIYCHLQTDCFAVS